MSFWFVQLEDFRRKLNFWKGSPVFPLEISDGTACSIHGFRKAFFPSSRPLSTISLVRKYGGYTTRIISELATNPTNAKTCLSREIGGLPNACCWWTLPVACTSRHRSSKVPRVILNWFSNSSTVYAGKIFSLKTLISVKIAPHLGCNGRQDRNEIIIWINETLLFQREV